MVSIKFEAVWPVVLTQILALLIAGTAVSSETLASTYSIVCPTFQTVGSYVIILLVYFPWYLARGNQPVQSLMKETWWKYALLGLVDFEANYTIVMAYKYTSITSIQILDASTVIFVMLLSYLLLRQRYTFLHYFFVFVVFLGMGLMIYSDIKNSDSSSVDAKWKGSLLVIVACGLYAISNVAAEFIVKNRPSGRIEYLSQLGFWGSFWSSIQLAVLERDELIELFSAENKSWAVIGWFACFWICLFLIYSLMPVAFGNSSAVFVNLGLMTADIFSLFIGIYVFGYIFDWLYILAFFVIFTAVIGFHVESWRFEKYITVRSNRDSKDHTDLTIL